MPAASIPATAAVLVSLLLPAAAMLDCHNIQANGIKFDFSKLAGPHSVITTQETPPTFRNTTYTIDLCNPLKRSGDVKKGDECPNGTWGESSCIPRDYSC
jgi:autophagy-related protein 27